MFDALSEVLVTPLAGGVASAASAAVNGAAKDFVASQPATVMVVAHVSQLDGAAKTLDAKVQGSDDGVTWADLHTFTQFAAVGVQMANIAAKRHYRAVHTPAGTFGAAERIGFGIYLIGIDLGHGPATQVA